MEVKKRIEEVKKEIKKMVDNGQSHNERVAFIHSQSLHFNRGVSSLDAIQNMNELRAYSYDFEEITDEDVEKVVESM